MNYDNIMANLDLEPDGTLYRVAIPAAIYCSVRDKEELKEVLTRYFGGWSLDPTYDERVYVGWASETASIEDYE